MKLDQFLLCVGVGTLLQVAGSYADCTFGYTTVPVCEWTPWSNFSCDGCCKKSSTEAKRTRGLCCPSGQRYCFPACGVHDIQSDKEEISDCSSCTCPGDPTTVKTPSGYICYKDVDDVAKCGDKCSGDRDWGQCVRDCSVNKVETLCTILETSLFFLGLALGISLSVLVGCLWWRRKRRTWDKRARSANSQRSTMNTLSNDHYNGYNNGYKNGYNNNYNGYNGYNGAYDSKRGMPPSYNLGNRINRVQVVGDPMSGADGLQDMAGQHGRGSGGLQPPLDAMYSYRGSNGGGRVPPTARQSVGIGLLGNQSSVADGNLNKWMHM